MPLFRISTLYCARVPPLKSLAFPVLVLFENRTALLLLINVFGIPDQRCADFLFILFPVRPSFFLPLPLLCSLIDCFISTARYLFQFDLVHRLSSLPPSLCSVFGFSPTDTSRNGGCNFSTRIYVPRLHFGPRIMHPGVVSLGTVRRSCLLRIRVDARNFGAPFARPVNQAFPCIYLSRSERFIAEGTFFSCSDSIRAASA